MIVLSMPEILNVTDGRLIHGDLAGAYTGYSTDTRTVKSGDLFIPIAGERFDANDFIPEAFAKGASWSLISDLSKVPSEAVLEDKGLIYVTDTLLALQNLAAYLLRKHPVPVIAVTGSTGKTSTKEMIASVLGTKYNVLKNEGNFNNHIGLPLTCLQLDFSHEVAILEMGMNHSGEIERLADITRPQWAVITNIGLSHIQNLGSRDGIFRAKMEVTRYMGSGDGLILNGDDDYLQLVRELDSVKIFHVGAREGCDYAMTDCILDGAEGSEFRLRMGSEEAQEILLKLHVPGCHNVQNASLAAAIGHQMGLTDPEIFRGLAEYHSNAMRMSLEETEDGVTIINDAYNASPDSMKAAIQVLHSLKAERRIALFSDMLELGDSSEFAHRMVGELVAEHHLDLLAVWGSHAPWIAEEALKSGMEAGQVHTFDTKESLMEWVLENSRSGDAILVKGSRSMKMEQIVGELLKRCNHEHH